MAGLGPSGSTTPAGRGRVRRQWFAPAPSSGIASRFTSLSKTTSRWASRGRRRAILLTAAARYIAEPLLISQRSFRFVIVLRPADREAGVVLVTSCFTAVDTI